MTTTQLPAQLAPGQSRPMPLVRRAFRDGLAVAGLVFAAYVMLVLGPAKGSMAFDVVAYWSVDLARPYGGNVGDLGFFAYSPPIALLLAPFTGLPWLLFVAGWYALLVGAVAWLGGRRVLLLLAFPPVAIELYHANIHLLLAVAMAVGFRYPAAWALVLLTKVTPGVGLLWFVARREWRQLGLALGATAVVVAVTLLILPGQWADWLALLSAQAGTPPPWPALPLPIWVRLPAAAALVWWGARRDAYWTVPAAATLALPALWVGGLAMLAACWRLPPFVPRYHSADAGSRRLGNLLAARLDRAARLQRGAAHRAGTR